MGNIPFKEVECISPQFSPNKGRGGVLTMRNNQIAKKTKIPLYFLRSILTMTKKKKKEKILVTMPSAAWEPDLSQLQFHLGCSNV